MDSFSFKVPLWNHPPVRPCSRSGVRASHAGKGNDILALARSKAVGLGGATKSGQSHMHACLRGIVSRIVQYIVVRPGDRTKEREGSFLLHFCCSGVGDFNAWLPLPQPDHTSKLHCNLLLLKTPTSPRPAIICTANLPLSFVAVVLVQVYSVCLK